MDPDLLRLLLLLISVRLIVAAATPAAVPSRRGAWGRSSRSSSRDVTSRTPGLLQLGDWTAPARLDEAESLLLPSGGGPARRRRTRRGGRGRPRGRRAGRRHRRGNVNGGAGRAGREGMCFVTLNIRSLKPKVLSLRHDLEFFDCDLCVLTETWLKPEIPSRYVNFPGYTFLREDRPDGRGYGGVAVLCKTDLKVKRLQSVCLSSECTLETVWLSVTNLRGRRLNVCAVYRPPHRSLAQFSADFDCLEVQVQRVLFSSTDPIIVTGDLNCNLLGSDTDPCKLRLLEFLDALSLSQHIRTPTYRSGSLLDVFITNRADLISNIVVRPCAYSDHSFLTARINVPKVRAKPRVILSRQICKMNIAAFYTALYETDWSPVFSRAGVAEQWTAFSNLFLPILDFHAPSRHIKLYNPSAPPVSDATLRLMAQRRGLLAQSGRTRAFIDLDRTVKSAIRRDMKQDIARRISEQGPTTLFRNIRQVIEGKKSAQRAAPEATPDELNEYFVGVGPRVAGEVRDRGQPPFLPCRLPRVGACAFALKPISLDFLRSTLFSMHNSGSCGSDGISIHILKICFDVLGHVFLYIINTCLTSCEYPDSWKHSIVHPIHKSGSPSETSNFRPISIVPAFPKLVEKVVQRQLYSYMSSNNLFSSSQHGFRSNHSTETALLTVSDHILSATDRQEITLLCLLDLSKCFDVIDHSKLLSKLQTYSIDPTWFSAYLSGHTQSVRAADGRGHYHLSRPLPIPIGIFQGSSLGPLLFQIFANDLSLYTPEAHVVQYADDTQILISGKKESLPQLIAIMEQSLSSLDGWFLSHGLKINTEKTELIVFGSRQNCRGMAPTTIRFREDTVRESPTVRNLGVLFDKYLSWDSHVSALVKKCNGILIGLTHVRHQIPSSLLPIIVDALVLSHVRYCMAVFGNGSENNTQRLQKVLNFCLRAVSGRRKFDHISDVRGELGWLTARQLYEFQSLNLLHKIRCTGEPQDIASYLSVNSQLRSRSTRQDADLALPRVRTNAGKRRFLYGTVRRYNELSSDVRSLSMSSFKRHLRSLFLDNT